MQNNKPVNTHRLKPTALAIMSLSMGMSLLATAETETLEHNKKSTLEEVIVTAQFRGQNLQDTPLSITAVTSDMLEARSQTNIADVARQAPNVTLTPLGGAFGPALGAAIRGVGQFDFNPAFEPGVGMYVDDVYYPTLTGAVFDLLDLERVEVLRGPQGTLTGRNAIGGAIKLISKRPDGEEKGYVSATYGSRHRMDLRASADFSLADNIFARVSGVHKSQDGYVDRVDYGCANQGNPEGIVALRPSGNCNYDALGAENYSGLRGMLRFKPSETFDLLISADYTNIDKTNGPETMLLSDNPNFLCGDDCNYANYRAPAAGGIFGDTTGKTATQTLIDPRNTFQGWGISANMDIALTDTLELKSITASRTYDASWGTDDDFSPDDGKSANGYNQLEHDFFSQELRLNGAIGDSMQYTVGAYYSDQESIYFTQQDIRYIVPGLALQFYGDDPVNSDSFAVFGTLISQLTEEITLTTGIRYTEESKDYKFLRRNLDGTVNTFLDPTGELNQTTAKYEGDNVDYRVSMDYRFTPDFLAYGTVSTGFKGGGVSPRPFNAVQALQGSFELETLTAYELGFKSSPFENTRLNMSVFYNEYEDVQLPIQDCSAYGGGPCGVRLNAGDAEFWGIELEIDAEPLPGLVINAAASYLDSEWTVVDPRVGASVTLDDPVSNSPELQASLGLQYEIDMNEGATITPRIDIAYTDERYVGRVVNNTPAYLDSYVLANARVSWRNSDENIVVSLEVTNLLDEDFATSRFDSVYAFSKTAYQTIGKPREWALTIKRDF